MLKIMIWNVWQDKGEDSNEERIRLEVQVPLGEAHQLLIPDKTVDCHSIHPHLLFISCGSPLHFNSRVGSCANRFILSRI